MNSDIDVRVSQAGETEPERPGKRDISSTAQSNGATSWYLTGGQKSVWLVKEVVIAMAEGVDVDMALEVSS
jgi:hypothetical protein